MDSNMSKKIQIGDIFEIKTSVGLCYAQYTHKHPTHSDVLRIFKTRYTSRPHQDRISDLTADEVEFTVLCAVGAAYRAKTIEKVGSLPIKEELIEFPKFRSGNIDPETKQVKNWWIWDGKMETKVGSSLTKEQKKYPRLVIRNIAAIRDLIEGNTHPGLL